MRTAVFVVGAIALVGAVSTGFLLNSAVTTSSVVVDSPVQIPKPKTVAILVAHSALEVGKTLAADNFEWQEWPEGTIRKEQGMAIATQDSERADVIHQYEGTILRSNMVRNEPFSEDKVLRAGGGGLLAVILAPGMRSMTVSVTAITGAAGLVQPGDRVDLLLTMNLADDRAGSVNQQTKRAIPRLATETILEDIKVISRERSLNPNLALDAPIPSNITLEVTPQQAEIIVTASKMGDFSLTMRPFRKGDDIERKGIPITTDVQVTPGLQASRRNILLRDVDKQENPFPGPSSEGLAPPTAKKGEEEKPKHIIGTITINRWTASQVIPTVDGKIVNATSGPLPPGSVRPVTQEGDGNTGNNAGNNTGNNTSNGTVKPKISDVPLKVPSNKNLPAPNNKESMQNNKELPPNNTNQVSTTPDN